MTYSTNEASVYSGKPVELYEFQRGADYWRYTSADEDQTYNAQTFVRTPITRSEIEEASELNRNNLEITLQRDNPVAELFRLYPPGVVVTLKIWRLHRGDTDAVLVWIGRVLNCEWRGGKPCCTRSRCTPRYAETPCADTTSASAHSYSTPAA